mmetsp:Transcript_14833/g.27820  ORF Transcript_14833/g.27820 Transcript_14833/m.27820 type:complete len:240 (+) Transcript_14833:1038-1757(+)
MPFRGYVVLGPRPPRILVPIFGEQLRAAKHQQSSEEVLAPAIAVVRPESVTPNTAVVFQQEGILRLLELLSQHGTGTELPPEDVQHAIKTLGGPGHGQSIPVEAATLPPGRLSRQVLEVLGLVPELQGLVGGLGIREAALFAILLQLEAAPFEEVPQELSTADPVTRLGAPRVVESQQLVAPKIPNFTGLELHGPRAGEPRRSHAARAPTSTLGPRHDRRDREGRWGAGNVTQPRVLKP